MNIFVDSCFFVSLLNPKEYFFNIAKKYSEQYIKSNFFINKLVIYETINVVYRKWGCKAASKIKKYLYSDNYQILEIDEDIERNAYSHFINQKSDKKSEYPNLFDHIHFASMKANGIDSVLTFDIHFASSGFTILNKTK